MNFDYTKIPKEKAYELRQKFIDTFVDTSHDLYVRYIRDLHASDTVNAQGFVVSFLWSCLHKSTASIVDFYVVMRYLHQLKSEKVFVMWDIRPEKIIYPPEWQAFSVYTPPCEFLLKSDEMISIEPKELCEVLLHDYHIEEHKTGDIAQCFLREDIYIFDETCLWYVALTHEEYNDKRLCLSNMQDFNAFCMD